MIRNNQNGRRRGRGGARPPQAGGNVPRENNYNNGGNNRVDVRQRGNAAQLLEKYKAMARDASQNGDRVAAEYYMQYADHYYRVLNDYRERQPDARPQQRRDFDEDDGGDGQNYAGQNYTNGSTNGASNYAVQGGEAARYEEDGDEAEAPPRRDAQTDGNRAPQQQNRDQRSRGDADQRRDDTRGNDGYNAPRRDDGRVNDNARADGGRNDSYRNDGARNDNARNDTARHDNARNGEARVSETRSNDDRFSDDGGASNGARSDVRREAPRAAEPSRQRDEAPIEFAGIPGPATTAAPAAGDEAPAPRKRGRPRKIVVEAAAEGDA